MSGTGARREIIIPADHPAYAGHFPAQPVLPGALLLDEALHAVEIERGIEVAQWRISSAKFLAMVRPGEALSIEHEASQGQIRVNIRAGDRPVASIRLAPLVPGGV